MVIDKNGVDVVENVNKDPADFEAYRIWMADRWKCPGCDLRVLSGFGMRPTARREDDAFAETLERILALPESLRVT